MEAREVPWPLDTTSTKRKGSKMKLAPTAALMLVAVALSGCAAQQPQLVETTQTIDAVYLACQRDLDPKFDQPDSTRWPTSYNWHVVDYTSYQVSVDVASTDAAGADITTHVECTAAPVPDALPATSADSWVVAESELTPG